MTDFASQSCIDMIWYALYITITIFYTNSNVVQSHHSTNPDDRLLRETAASQSCIDMIWRIFAILFATPNMLSMEFTNVSELQHTYTRNEYERQVYSRMDSCGCLLGKAPDYKVEVKEYEELRDQLRILEGKFRNIRNRVKFQSFEKSAKKLEKWVLPARPENDEPASGGSDASGAPDASDASGAPDAVRTHHPPPATVQKVRERRPLSHIQPKLAAHF